jgi:hypothetical protein
LPDGFANLKTALGDPRSELEDELDEILRSARNDAGRLITGIHKRYADQCT